MPQRLPIKLFNTGIGFKEGDPDPHWQLVARSDDPKFKPRPAVVTAVFPPAYRLNNPARSQWISTASNLPSLPAGVFTFRTTFELADAAPESAILKGRFLADNHVDAIRINGHAASVPEHGVSPPLDQFPSFLVQRGFFKGTNVLEIDVYNFAAIVGSGHAHGAPGRIGGFTLREWHCSRTSARTPGDETQKGGRPMNVV